MAQAKHGTGTIYKHKNGSYIWQGSYVDEFGKKHRPIKTFKTEAEALLFQAEQINNVEIKKRKAHKDMTYSELFDEWKEQVKSGKVKVSETTRVNSISNIEKHILPQIGNNNINKISTLTLNRYFDSLIDSGRSKKTVYNIFTDFKKIIKYGIDKKYIYNDCLEDFNIKQEPIHKVVNTLTIDEYNKLINCEKNKNDFYLPHIMFLAETGLRIEELAIKEDDFVIEGDISYIYVYKSIVRALEDDDKTTKLKVLDNVKNESSYRRVPINAFAEDIIIKQIYYNKEHNVNSEYIFCNTKGGYLEKRTLLRSFHRFCENAGIEKRGLHSLRKLYINNALSNGATPFDLAKITGHSMQTMFKYYHDIDDKALKRVLIASQKHRW